MSRAKRVRKARMKVRQAKRFDKRIAAASAFFVDARERARARAEINASDAPKALKDVLGFLIDPWGAALDAVNKAIKSDELAQQTAHNVEVFRKEEP